MVAREEAARPPLKLWGGIECTVNRVGDRYLDQLARGGHAARPEDLDRLAALGLRTLRYPVLWERVAPDGLARADWSWADDRLGRLRSLGVEPIVGLLHHGSGPRDTSLLAPDFPERFARYARAVAERHPWVRRWTPINEPLTTARFSALYGHWYPHARCPRAFARAVVQQCRAIGLAMREIRRVRPDAALVQTEDLGRTYATPRLAYQAEHENERRWLTFDLLLGRVDAAHPMWRPLRDAGIGAGELARLRDEPCAPELLGLNHYVTSERWLDERLDRHPPATHGGNGRDAYADVEAVRARPAGIGGPRAMLDEAWARYGRPLAITEAHLACTREEQLRWLHEVWTAAQGARADGADVRAVTAWSLLGAHDWDSLVTRDDGRYEPGAFDLRAPAPRPTALAAMVRDLARHGRAAHPVLDTPGWWRRDDRLAAHAPDDAADAPAPWRGAPAVLRGRPILVVGAGGRLGRAFAALCARRGLAHHAAARAEVDVADAASVARALDAVRPWAVVNAAGRADPDAAERAPAACRRDHALGPATLAAACARRGLALLTLSSDRVFDGADAADGADGADGPRAAPYVERDAPCPLGVHGRSQALAERLVLARLPSALVVRAGPCFGAPGDDGDVLAATLRALEAGLPVAMADDAVVSPTRVPDLVHAALDLLVDGERGVWHLATPGAVTWAAFARRLAALAGLDPALVVGRTTAPRPAYRALASERGTLLPPLDDALRAALAGLGAGACGPR